MKQKNPSPLVTLSGVLYYVDAHTDLRKAL